MPSVSETSFCFNVGVQHVVFIMNDQANLCLQLLRLVRFVLWSVFLVLRHWSCSLPVIVGGGDGDDIIDLVLISDQLDL